MANLLKCKPLDMLMAEASETGEHSLKRALGPVNLITLGIGAIRSEERRVGKECRSRWSPYH